MVLPSDGYQDPESKRHSHKSLLADRLSYSTQTQRGEFFICLVTVVTVVTGSVEPLSHPPQIKNHFFQTVHYCLRLARIGCKLLSKSGKRLKNFTMCEVSIFSNMVSKSQNKFVLTYRGFGKIIGGIVSSKACLANSEELLIHFIKKLFTSV